MFTHIYLDTCTSVRAATDSGWRHPATHRHTGGILLPTCTLRSNIQACLSFGWQLLFLNLRRCGILTFRANKIKCVKDCKTRDLLNNEIVV